MPFDIRMGIPEMERLWNNLQTKHRTSKASKQEDQLYKRWGKARRGVDHHRWPRVPPRGRQAGCL